MFLREVAIAADERIAERFKGGFVRQFESETTCVTELYRYLLRGKVQTDRVWKALFFFTDEINSPPEHPRPMRCYWPFDFESYIDATDDSKREMIADSLHCALMWLGKELTWSLESFTSARAEALRRGIVLEGYLKRTWPSPDRRYRIRIFYRFSLRTVDLYAVLVRFRSNAELERVLLGSPRPYPGCLVEYTSHGEWTSPTTFELHSSSFARQSWVAHLARQ